MTAYQKAEDLLRGQGLGLKINNTHTHIGQNTHHDERQHYVKTDLGQQHSKATTHDHIMQS